MMISKFHLFTVFLTTACLPAICFADESVKPIIIDSHFHFTSPANAADTTVGSIFGPVTSKEAFPLLDASGISKAVILGTAYQLSERAQVESENNYVAEEVKKYPDRLIGFCGIPLKATWYLEEVERCINVLGMKGLKIHLVANRMHLSNPDDLELVKGVFKKASELKKGLPIVMDFQWADPLQIQIALEHLVMTFPDVNLIFPHAFGHHFRELINIALLHEIAPQFFNNVYIDVSATALLYPPGTPEFESYIWHLRRFGMNKIFFGSDFPATKPEDILKAIRSWGLTEKELNGILGENIQRAFGF